MLRLLTILSTMIFSCGPAELKTTNDTAVIEDDRSWLTWDECGHDIGDNPCNLVLLDHNANEVELYNYYGKVIVIDFSTMWCGICINIANEGDNLIAKYGDENVIWLTVLIENESRFDPSQDDLKRWVENFNTQTPVLGGNRNLIDMSAEVGYPITSWPTLVVIDREMVLRHGINGWNQNAIDAWVSGLL